MRWAPILMLMQFYLFHLVHCYIWNQFVNLKRDEFSENIIHSISKSLSPVVLIPGIGGNKLQAKIQKSNAPYFWCSKEADYFDIWINWYQMIPGAIDCWIDNMKLEYDNVTREAKNSQGVEFRFPELESPEAVEWVAQDHDISFKDIIASLKHHGYDPGENLFGVPYDFRKGPRENIIWFKRLKQLTEHAVLRNNNIGVTFVVHSMGGRVLLHFLQQMPQFWKDKYVKRIIAMGVPWGGSVLSMQAASTGHSVLFFVGNDKMNAIEKTFSSIVWLMPSHRFWKSNEILAVINGNKYTLATLSEFFNDIGVPNVNEMRMDALAYENYNGPGVEIHCLFGTNVDTVEKLDFGTSFNFYPKIVNGNGDGYVNERSLNSCTNWRNTSAQSNHKIYQKEFPGVDHLKILHSSESIAYTLNTLLNGF